MIGVRGVLLSFLFHKSCRSSPTRVFDRPVVVSTSSCHHHPCWSLHHVDGSWCSIYQEEGTDIHCSKQYYQQLVDWQSSLSLLLSYRQVVDITGDTAGELSTTTWHSARRRLQLFRCLLRDHDAHRAVQLWSHDCPWYVLSISATGGLTALVGRLGQWVGSHLALSLHSSNIHDPCLSVVSVLTPRFKRFTYMYTCCAVLRGSLLC